MPIEVEGPDGQLHPFPDGTAQAAINAAMQQRYPSVQGGALQPLTQSQAGPGTATVLGGNVQPDSLVQPEYRSPADRRDMMMGSLFPHMAPFMLQAPGRQREVERQKVIGKQLGEAEMQQATGRRVIDQLDHLMGAVMFENYAPGVSPQELRPVRGLNEAIGPLNSVDMFQRWRQGATRGLFGTSEGYELHNRLMHAVEAMGHMVSGGGGSGGTNQNQEVLMGIVNRIMRANSPEQAANVLADARNVLAAYYKLTPGAPVANSGSNRPQPPPTARPRARNAQGAEVEWNGTAWVPVP